MAVHVFIFVFWLPLEKKLLKDRLLLVKLHKDGIQEAG